MSDRRDQEPHTTAAASDAAVATALDADLLEALDRHIGQAMPGASRSEALRQVVRAWAEQHGLVDGDEGLRPDELNASNDD